MIQQIFSSQYPVGSAQQQQQQIMLNQGVPLQHQLGYTQSMALSAPLMNSPGFMSALATQQSPGVGQQMQHLNKTAFKMPTLKLGQRLFWEFKSPEGRPFYFDNERQWEYPGDGKDGTIVVINAQKYQEQMVQSIYTQQQATMQHQPHEIEINSHQQVSISHTADGSIGEAIKVEKPKKLQQTQMDLQDSAHGGQYQKQGPPGANLFIFHLPNEWSDIDLFMFFDQFKLGKIVSVRIMTDKENGRSKGFGFVSYDNSHAANMAIKVINGKQALGKRLKVELKKGGIGPAHLQQAQAESYYGESQKAFSRYGGMKGSRQHQQQQYSSDFSHHQMGVTQNPSSQYSTLTSIIYEGTQNSGGMGRYSSQGTLCNNSNSVGSMLLKQLSSQQNGDSMSANSFFR